MKKWLERKNKDPGSSPSGLEWPLFPCHPAGSPEKTSVDPVLFYVAIILAALGLVMVYSASAVYALDRTGDAMYYFKRQILCLALGSVAFWFGIRFGYNRLVGLAYPLLLLTIALLVGVLIPGIGSRAGGAARWLRVGVLSFQPAELAKVTFVIYLACSLTRKKEIIQIFSTGFLPHLIVSGVLILLLLKEPDFGTATTLAVLLFLMLFVAGTRVFYIVLSALAAIPMGYLLIAGSPYRMRRLLAFLDPWANRLDIGYQVSESLISFGSGGVGGVGLGEGKHKLFFLPAAHTDFIFAIIGEELGMIGAVLVFGLFVVLVWRGILAAMRAPDLFGTYLGFGLTALIGLQTLINIGVVVGVLPTKGLTLPLISYGGSSLVCSCWAIGILLNISASARAMDRVVHMDSKLTWPAMPA